MNELLRKSIRIATFFLSACFLVWAFLPDWRIYAAGVILGVVASVINGMMLRRRVDMIGTVFTNNPNAPRKASLGLASRLATVLLVAMVAYKYPETFHLPSVLLSCFFMPIVTLVLAYAGNRKNDT